ncbi:MAG: penicillin-binding protein activator LpoB [Treponema porcinum]|uniref:penicillin-binding protein activator LpoB n=1 Tax=Treponema porcinum TaxID=261392 RepID=UPI002354D71C|nr:penicillin-binding protein activator LpoB [Treponema porcinum]MCI6178961.1 penicillin-binding protein activator LpoB [Treponema porcinum]MCI6323063.1 penicillin-binding protein activator LpoB [Treponema porcinum]MCI6721788.1 penicillin-binding protein activator LpoB [Treponema porcinum]MCI6816221.1 penicillin-binding protein activator LpoB [Treponema porcinum]MCI6983657.1 penicillin-binding protein activator LpoB [Treponema porcinum]
MAKQILTIAAVSAALIFSSCASNNVSRVSSETVTDLSGYWNDTDVRLVAGEIIDGCLASPRIAQYPSQHGGKLPVVIVGSYRNKSDEHIDTEILTKKLEAALVNSGKVEFVASSAERNELRAERIDQQTNASESTAKSLGNETGADFMLQGSVKTIVDSDGKTMARSYFVTTEMIDIETNKKIWMDDNSSIKKVIKRSSTRM